MTARDQVQRAAEWLRDLAEKMKAIAAAVSAFVAVVLAATAKEALSLDDVVSILTAATVLAGTIYVIVWRVPNKGHVNINSLSVEQRRAIISLSEASEES